MSDESENNRFLCAYHREAVNKQHNKIWTMALVVLLLSFIATTFAISNVFDVENKFAAFNKVLNDNAGLARLTYATIDNYDAKQSVYLRFKLEAEKLKLTGKYETPLAVNQHWENPTTGLKGQDYRQHKAFLDKDVDSSFQTRSVDDVLQETQKGWGGGKSPSTAARAAKYCRKSLLGRGLQINSSYELFRQCKTAIDLSHISNQNHFDKLYAELTQKLSPNDRHSRYDAIPFKTAENIPLIISTMTDLVTALGYRGYMHLAMGMKRPQDTVYTSIGNNRPLNYDSLKEQLDKLTLDEIYQALTFLSGSQTDLVAKGIKSSYFGIAFHIPLTPFLLLAFVLTPFYFMMLAIQQRRLDEHKRLVLTLERDCNNNTYQPEGVWKSIPPILDAYPFGQYFFEPNRLLTIALRTTLFIMHVAIGARCIRLGYDQSLWAWLGIELNGMVSILVFAVLAMLIYALCLKGILQPYIANFISRVRDGEPSLTETGAQ